MPQLLPLQTNKLWFYWDVTKTTIRFTNCKQLTGHSGWQKLLQVMKGSRRNPLTPVRWDHMWLKNGIFEKKWLGYLTNKFSKTKTVPIWPHFSTIISNILMFNSMIYSIWVKNKISKISRVISRQFSTLKIAKKCQKSPFWLIWSKMNLNRQNTWLLAHFWYYLLM